MKLQMGIAEILYLALLKLAAIPSTPSSMKLCAKINTNRLGADVTEFTKQKNELLSKYGKKNDSGNFAIAPNDQNWKDFMGEYEPLIKQEADFNIATCAYNQDEFYEMLFGLGKDVDAVNLSMDEIDILKLICKTEKE